MAARHLKTGAAGEDAAETYLRKKGYAIVARNWRKASWEIDLVCKQKKTLIFVEVKTRKAGSRTSPAEGLTRTKQARLAKAASLYLSEHKAWNAPCRFDLISVVDGPEGPAIEHLENAFEIGAAGGPDYQPF